MKIKKYIFTFLFISVLASMASCSDDKFTDTIFPDVSDQLDPTSYTYKLDKWLKVNYLDPYNLDFKYKMEDVGTNMNYNLVPAEYGKARDLAVLTKYLWFDVYNKIAGEEFLKAYGPRIIHIVGSPAYNPTSGTEIVGLAEGGIKVTLFKVNELDETNFYQLNEYYFKTMHHEFAHILHQTKSYPTEFNLLSNGLYDANNWQSRADGVVNSLGFVTPYGSSQTREDFAETIANFIVKTDAQWARILELASRGWATPSSADDKDAIYYCYYYYVDNVTDEANKKYVDESSVVSETKDGKTVYYHASLRDKSGNRIIVSPVPDTDGKDGKAIILQKVDIARTWFKEQWKVSLDSLRSEVQRRQTNIDMKALRQQVEDVK